jgi:hypothetical protein
VSGRPLGALAALALLGGALAACDLPASPRRPHLLTFADLQALADGPDPTFANDSGVPGGLRVGDYVTKQIGKDGTASYFPTLRNTWTEGYRSAYETAEIWTAFDEVWVQPAYVPITGFESDGTPIPLTEPGAAAPDAGVTEPDAAAADPDGGADASSAAPPARAWSPIFSVGPDSAFYSPFWQLFYFQVPAGTDPDDYTTARKVIDSGLPLIPGPGRTMSIVPGDITVPRVGMASGQHVGGPAGSSPGYLDGRDVKFLDFGKGSFSWNDDLVVDATPLFMFVARDDQGNLQRMNVPTVAGTGPLYANRPPNVRVNTTPHYGSFWRLYTVEVPPAARIFAPPQLFAAESADFLPQRLVVPADGYGPSVIAAGADDVSQWLGRLALNALPSATDASEHGCFSDYDNLDTSSSTALPHCQWLDSQPAIERSVPSSWIHRTDILVTCPFVSYHDVAVVVTP